MTEPAEYDLRPATRDDVPLIRAFVEELAEYERLRHAVEATDERLEATLFGERPAAEVVIAEVGGKPAGFALFFLNYSTFLAQTGIYLEDLYVRPEFRGLGIGHGLLTHLARLALERGCGRLDWEVLDWNEPAIGFYRRIGARSLDDWMHFRLDGDALDSMAREGQT